MGTKEFAAQMRAEIEALKQQGTAAIYTENLINYLTSVESSPEQNPSPTELERYKAELSQHVETVKHNYASSLESFKAVIAAGQNAIRSMILINGGASVAMLAFLGHLAQIGSTSIPVYANCLLPFVVGTLIGGLVSGGTYLSQFLYGGKTIRVQKFGGYVNIAVIILGMSSFAAFGTGAWTTYQAFLNSPPTANVAFTTSP